MSGPTELSGGRPYIDFEVLRAADVPEFESEYSKDYWDLVFEQLGKRALFKFGMVFLTLLYGVAAFAPLLANGKPLSIESVAIGEFSRAARVSPMASSAVGVMGQTEEEFAAEASSGPEDAPATRYEKISAEYDAAMLRVTTMRRMLPDEKAALLDPFVAAFEAGLESLKDGDDAAALAGFEEAKTISRELRGELRAFDPERPDREGIHLVARSASPLLESIAAWEVFLMTIWLLVATWPIWNRVCNAVVLRGDRERVRSARRWKLGAVLLVAVVSAIGWHARYGPVAGFDASDYKSGITDGSIVLLAAGETTASLAPPPAPEGGDEGGEESGDGGEAAVEEAAAPERDVSGLVTWALIPYSYDELHEDEVFRAPTWTAAGELDPETGRSVVAMERMDESDDTGVSAEASPVQVRAGEPPLNDPWRHLLGTDASGRDILTRMIWGARISLSVGILSALLLTIIGVVMGSLAGYFGGWVDTLIMRGIEILQTIPALFLILLALAFTPPGTIPPMFAVVIVIAVVRWTGVARLVRGEFMRLRDQEFVVAAEALGFSSRRTIFRHVLPNAMSPVLVAAAFSVAAGILTESAVSFLGLGIKEPQASWGGVVNESRNVDLWWIQVFPGLAIFVTVTCYNLVGDAIRDAMDPKQRV